MRGHPKRKKQIPRNERIISEIGEEKYEYIISHHGRPRTTVARNVGITKFQLNQYYITLFPREAM